MQELQEKSQQIEMAYEAFQLRIEAEKLKAFGFCIYSQPVPNFKYKDFKINILCNS